MYYTYLAKRPKPYLGLSGVGTRRTSQKENPFGLVTRRLLEQTTCTCYPFLFTLKVFGLQVVTTPDREQSTQVTDAPNETGRLRSLEQVMDQGSGCRSVVGPLLVPLKFFLHARHTPFDHKSRVNLRTLVRVDTDTSPPFHCRNGKSRHVYNGPALWKGYDYSQKRPSGRGTDDYWKRVFYGSTTLLSYPYSSPRFLSVPSLHPPLELKKSFMWEQTSLLIFYPAPVCHDRRTTRRLPPRTRQEQ